MLQVSTTKLISQRVRRFTGIGLSVRQIQFAVFWVCCDAVCSGVIGYSEDPEDGNSLVNRNVGILPRHYAEDRSFNIHRE